jgi:hypothetical protein
MSIPYSDTTNKNGLIQLCEIYTGLGDGNISGNATLLKQFTRLINNAFQKHVTTILESEDDWDFDDSSLLSNYPIATRPMVAAQRDYKFTTGLWSLLYPEGTTGNTVTITIASPGVFTANNHGLRVNDAIQLTTTGALPTGLAASTTYYVISAGLGANAFEVSATQGGSAINTSGTQSGTHSFTQSIITALKIKRVDFTYDGTNWNKANPLDPSTIRVGIGNDTNLDNNFIKTNPYYDIESNALWVYPMAVSSDVTSGAKMRIQFWREPTEFLSGDTTKVVPIESAFVPLIGLDACVDYALMNIPSAVTVLQARYADLEARMRRFQSTKNEDDGYQLKQSYVNYN